MQKNISTNLTLKMHSCVYDIQSVTGPMISRSALKLSADVFGTQQPWLRGNVKWLGLDTCGLHS